MEESIKSLKSQAKEALRGKWNMLALIEFLSSLCVGFVWLLLTGPLNKARFLAANKAIDREDISLLIILDGFKNFIDVVMVYVVNLLITVLWGLLFIIPGIIKALSFSMSYFIMIDNPTLDYNKVREQSVELTRGNKGKIFRIYMSFIGWYILSIFTFGILMFFVHPYIRATLALYYRSIAPEQNNQNADMEFADVEIN